MEYRRLKRIRNGRIVKDGLTRHLNSAMKGIIVVLLLAEVFDITTQRFGIQQIWIIPAALTLALVIPAALQTLYYPEHTFTLWVSTELYAFCLWFAWWFDARDQTQEDHLHCWDLPKTAWFTADQICLDWNQIWAFYGFVIILSVTVLLFLPHRVIMPCAIYLNFLQGRWLVAWRAVRRLPKLPGDRDDSWHYTYKPSGLFGWNREEFMYIGEVDGDGRPHGGGFWYDSSFHGECLRGEWVHGAPAGMWFSREYGTGAHFLQCAVGYATSRSDCQEDYLNKSAWIPSKESDVRFGLGQVEASFAGGFFPFLPAVNYHSAMSSGEDMVEQLLQCYRKRQAHEESTTFRLEVVPEGIVREMGMDDWSSVPIHFPEGDNTGFVVASSITRVRSLRPDAEALVFIHGFNCDLATALGRVVSFGLQSLKPSLRPSLRPSVQPVSFRAVEHSSGTGVLVDDGQCLPTWCRFDHAIFFQI
ncbi:RNase H domain-containing protein [Durusdinium trenchii]|uniref:RNase H domain-containing protein n=1 Tax=Durusdinium trenchii TaxID=1381693 RepID=A0ABP0KIJ0_9DINO